MNYSSAAEKCRYLIFCYVISHYSDLIYGMYCGLILPHKIQNTVWMNTQNVIEDLEVSVIKRILSGCLVIGIVAAMIGFQFIFPYSLNIIMALITATAVFELVSAVGLRKNLTFLLPSVAFALAIPLIPNQMYDLPWSHIFCTPFLCWVLQYIIIKRLNLKILV